MGSKPNSFINMLTNKNMLKSSDGAQNPKYSETINMFKLVNEKIKESNRKEASKFKNQEEEEEVESLVDGKLVSDCVPQSKKSSLSADSTSSFYSDSITDSDSSLSKDLSIYDKKKSLEILIKD